MRALTGLKQAGMLGRLPDGRPPEMPLNKIMRDPDNLRPPLHLRTPEEQQMQRELNASIKKRGVKSPISLRSHPSIPDMWIINHGHCRFDAAEAEGLATIPYFLDPNFDSYDQIAENLHRADLSPWAIAEFIKRKLGQGESKGKIAEGLGKESQNFITEHLALVDAPGCVHQAYVNGVRSPRTLYDLRRAYDEFAEQVDAWCGSATSITRGAIKELLDELRHDVKGAAADVPEMTGTSVGTDAAMDGGPQALDDVTQVTSQIVEHEAAQQSVAALDVIAELAAVAPQPDEEATSRNEPGSATVPSSPLKVATKASDIDVRYKGEAAKIAPDATVRIVLRGRRVPLEVPVSELVFTGSK